MGAAALVGGMAVGRLGAEEDGPRDWRGIFAAFERLMWVEY